MSRPVGSASPSLTEVNFNEVESEPITVPARTQSQPQGSQVESWSGQQPTVSFPAAERGPVLSGQDLAAQSAREAAERQAALKSLGGLEDSLTKLAKKYPDPIGFLGYTEFKNKDVSLGAFGKAVRDEDFDSAVSTLSASDVRASVDAQVKKAWPHSTPEQTEKLKQYFMRQICESLRERAAPKLQAVATKMLEDAAGQFMKAASDPEQVKQLAARLTEMAHPLAEPDQQAQVRDLRAAMGLDPDQAIVTPENLTIAMSERAHLLKEEAKKMKGHGRETLFRALVDQDVGAKFKEAAGVREGSLLAAQIDAVKGVGESEANRIAWVKVASIAAAGALTGGLALGGTGLTGTVVGIAGSSMMEAPAVMHAWESVGTAQASESAGTMKAGAGEEARRHAVIETAVAATGVAAATGINGALHGVAHHPAAKVGLHFAVEFAVGAAGMQGAHALDGALESTGEASGKNALERLKP